jgi:hypothetical protein
MKDYRNKAPYFFQKKQKDTKVAYLIFFDLPKTKLLKACQFDHFHLKTDG